MGEGGERIHTAKRRMKDGGKRYILGKKSRNLHHEPLEKSSGFRGAATHLITTVTKRTGRDKQSYNSGLMHFIRTTKS